MTEFDKKLIQKANGIPRLEYRTIDYIIDLADTPEAVKILHNIRWEKYSLVRETI